MLSCTSPRVLLPAHTPICTHTYTHTPRMIRNFSMLLQDKNLWKLVCRTEFIISEKKFTHCLSTGFREFRQVYKIHHPHISVAESLWIYVHLHRYYVHSHHHLSRDILQITEERVLCALSQSTALRFSRLLDLPHLEFLMKSRDIHSLCLLLQPSLLLLRLIYAVCV